MNKECNKYKPEHISRFVDKELEPGDYQAVLKHIDNCPECTNLVNQYKALSNRFKSHVDQEVLKFDTTGLKQNIADIVQKPGKISLGNIFGFSGINKYLKLASITAILMISLFVFQKGLLGPTGPSAIVKSIDTDFESVMIIETQKEKHTIIWFSET